MRYWILLTVFSVLIVASVGWYFLAASPQEIINEPPSPTRAQIQTPTVAHLKLEQFFDSDTSITHQYPSESIRTLIVTGDIIPARSVNYKTITYNNFHWAFEPTAEYLRDADITFVNLEAPIFENCPVTNEGMIFCGDARHIQGLTFAGVDVANMGNNHAGNHGTVGINQTLSLLDAHGITTVGVKNNPQYIDVRGVTFAFLGYDDIEQQDGVSRADTEILQHEIQNARQNADVVIVQFHWGVEYVSQPSTRQRELGKLAVDAGADLIIGNHPHWIQPIEIYNNTLITYAHGNFIFDQMWSQKTQEGVIGKYYFYNNTLIDAEYLPIRIVDYGQAQFITNLQDKERILQDMLNESLILLKDKNIILQ